MAGSSVTMLAAAWLQPVWTVTGYVVVAVVMYVHGRRPWPRAARYGGSLVAIALAGAAAEAVALAATTTAGHGGGPARALALFVAMTAGGAALDWLMRRWRRGLDPGWFWVGSSIAMVAVALAAHEWLQDPLPARIAVLAALAAGLRKVRLRRQSRRRSLMIWLGAAVVTIAIVHAAARTLALLEVGLVVGVSGQIAAVTLAAALVETKLVRRLELRWWPPRVALDERLPRRGADWLPMLPLLGAASGTLVAIGAGQRGLLIGAAVVLLALAGAFGVRVRGRPRAAGAVPAGAAGAAPADAAGAVLSGEAAIHLVEISRAAGVYVFRVSDRVGQWEPSPGSSYTAELVPEGLLIREVNPDDRQR
jgi:hypothetical protein